jgi:hypothetical protein
MVRCMSRASKLWSKMMDVYQALGARAYMHASVLICTKLIRLIQRCYYFLHELVQRFYCFLHALHIILLLTA